MLPIEKMKKIFDGLELRVQVYAMVYVVSSLLSLIGLVLGIIFQVPFWMNIPHVVTIVMCLVIPAIFRKDPVRTFTVVVTYVAVLYLPIVLFTNGGAEGAGAIYLMMIIVFYAFHLTGRILMVTVLALNAYYMGIIVLAHNHPSLVVPYPDEISHVIDLSVAVVAVSSVLVIISYTAFSSYKKERRTVFRLMKELKEQNEVLEDLTVRDQLTGLFTRGYLLEKLSEEIGLVARDDVIFYILMVDIDHFKCINDTQGHLFGDEVICRVTKLMSSNIRSYDIAARYGGEEFILLLSHLSQETGCDVAERIRREIEAVTFRHGVKVTVSIGVSTYRKGDTAEIMIERADQGLYEAKNTGRNKVCAG